MVNSTPLSRTQVTFPAVDLFLRFTVILRRISWTLLYPQKVRNNIISFLRRVPRWGLQWLRLRQRISIISRLTFCSPLPSTHDTWRGFFRTKGGQSGFKTYKFWTMLVPELTAGRESVETPATPRSSDKRNAVFLNRGLHIVNLNSANMIRKG